MQIQIYTTHIDINGIVNHIYIEPNNVYMCVDGSYEHIYYVYADPYTHIYVISSRRVPVCTSVYCQALCIFRYGIIHLASLSI